jgi:hypothetical protein
VIGNRRRNAALRPKHLHLLTQLAGIGLAFAGAVAMLTVATGNAAAQNAGVKDPLKLFEPMMTTLNSPRCQNCHGGVNAITGDNHPGGAIDDVPLDSNGDMQVADGTNSACLTCHDEADTSTGDSAWRLAPHALTFVGKDTPAMCEQMRQRNGLTTGDPEQFDAFLRHVSNDQLIGFAFEGRRGMTDNTPDPPPTTRSAFVDQATHWLNEGQAACGPWNGSITATFSASSVEPELDEAADLKVAIDVKGSDATATVHLATHSLLDPKPLSDGCRLYRHSTLAFDTQVPIGFAVLFPRDLAAAVPGFQIPVVPAVPNLPNLPNLPNIPNLPTLPNSPAVPSAASVPGQSGLAPGQYLLVFSAPLMQTTLHTEQVVEPGCKVTVSDMPFRLALPAANFQKSLDPNNPDHLHDTGTYPGGLSLVTATPATAISDLATTWDLTRN